VSDPPALSPAFFFRARERPFDAAWMHPQPEAVLHLPSEVDGSGRAIRRVGLLKKREDVAGDLVAPVRSPFVRQQARQPALLKGPLRVIERGTREMERRGRRGHRLRFEFDPPEHLVLDLDDVARIEEVVRSEGGIRDLVGAAIQRAVDPQRLDLGIGGWAARLGRHVIIQLRHTSASCQVIIEAQMPIAWLYYSSQAIAVAGTRPDTAALSPLQLRHNLLDTEGVPSSVVSRSSLDLGDQVAQTEQVAWTTEGPPAGGRDIRIRLAHIGPIRRHRREHARAVVIEHPVLAPGLLDRHDLKRLAGQRMKGMRDAEESLRSRAINRS